MVELVVLAVVVLPVALATVIAARVQGHREFFRWPAVWAGLVFVGAFLTTGKRPGSTPDAALITALWQGSLVYALGVAVVLIIRRARASR